MHGYLRKIIRVFWKAITKEPHKTTLPWDCSHFCGLFCGLESDPEKFLFFKNGGIICTWIKTDEIQKWKGLSKWLLWVEMSVFKIPLETRGWDLGVTEDTQIAKM